MFLSKKRPWQHTHSFLKWETHPEFNRSVVWAGNAELSSVGDSLGFSGQHYRVPCQTVLDSQSNTGRQPRTPHRGVALGLGSCGHNCHTHLSHASSFTALLGQYQAFCRLPVTLLSPGIRKSPVVPTGRGSPLCGHKEQGHLHMLRTLGREGPPAWPLLTCEPQKGSAGKLNQELCCGFAGVTYKIKQRNHTKNPKLVRMILCPAGFMPHKTAHPNGRFLPLETFLWNATHSPLF